MVSHSGRHRWRHTQRLVNTAKVVVHEIDGNHVLVVFSLLGEPVGQPGKAAHSHPHGKIGPFDVAG